MLARTAERSRIDQRKPGRLHRAVFALQKVIICKQKPHNQPQFPAVTSFLVHDRLPSDVSVHTIEYHLTVAPFGSIMCNAVSGQNFCTVTGIAMSATSSSEEH